MDVHADLDSLSARELQDHLASGWINQDGMVDKVGDGGLVPFASSVEIGQPVDIGRVSLTCRIARRPIPLFFRIHRNGERCSHWGFLANHLEMVKHFRVFGILRVRAFVLDGSLRLVLFVVNPVPTVVVFDCKT
jgi:hypothetical protein